MTDYNVKVDKHFEEADYKVFIVHRIPFTKHSISRSHEAKASGEAWITVVKDKETKLRIEIPKFRVEEGVRLCRVDLKLFGESGPDYGHWWIEVGDKSYGWWPEEGQLGGKDLPPPQEPAPLPDSAGIIDRIKHLAASASYRAHKARYDANYSTVGQYGQAFYKTFTGVPGILNGNDYYKNDIEQDPHHGDWKTGKTDEDYYPVIDDCRTKEEISKSIRDFAFGYSGNWSWIFESGNNCHTFQKVAMSKLKLNKVKKI